MYNYTVFENWLKENGGTAEINDTPADPYGNEIIAAYAERGNIESYAEFLKRYRKAVLSDTEFFLCLSDFRSVENSEGFEWDTFKKISLDSYDEDEDEEKKQIEKRWDDHLPILLGVGGEYFFYALELSPQPGKIVFGFEPEFEETSYCADSFEDFLNKLITGKIIVGYDCDPDEDF